jgi:uncharacterized protein (DUF111 family)
MKILYFDNFSGISGDMAIGALLDLGIDQRAFLNELKKLNLGGGALNVSAGSATHVPNRNALRKYRSNAFFCDAQHSGARRTQLA